MKTANSQEKNPTSFEQLEEFVWTFQKKIDL